MNKTQQRIAIGKFLGWETFPHEEPSHFGHLFAINPNGKDDFMPNYPADLNAMHDALNYLRNADRMAYQDYGGELHAIVAEYNSRPSRQAYHAILVCDADADMRAAAMVKALNLWTPNGEENE